MKKIIVLIIPILAWSAWAAPEEKEPTSSYSITPMVGTTAYTIEDAPMSSTAGGGISVGIALQKTIDNYLEIQGGLNYFETVSRFTTAIPVDVEVKNLGLLLKAKYYTNKQETEVYSFYLTGALTPSFVLAATAADVDFKSDTPSIGLFANLGIGTDIRFDGGRVSVDLTYNRAFTKVNKNSDGYFSGWQLGLAYSIPL